MMRSSTLSIARLALLAGDAGDGGVVALEVGGGAVLEERRIGDLAVGVGLEGAGEGDGLGDEGLQALGAEVGEIGRAHV